MRYSIIDKFSFKKSLRVSINVEILQYKLNLLCRRITAGRKKTYHIVYVEKVEWRLEGQ